MWASSPDCMAEYVQSLSNSAGQDDTGAKPIALAMSI
jgi:hypothetical protein